MAEFKLRERNVAHAWWDKRILRHFRKNHSKKSHKNLRTIYLALCEIDSDFSERRGEDGTLPINGLIQTCATYAGVDRKIAMVYLKALREMKLIDYGRTRQEDGTLGSSYLRLWLFDETIHQKSDFGTKVNQRSEKPPEVKSPHKNNTKVLASNKKKKTKFSICRSNSSSLSKRLQFVFNGEPFDPSKWLPYPLKSQADRPILDVVTRLARQKMKKPHSKIIKEVLDYWNDFAFRSKHNGLRVSSHMFGRSKAFYKIQLLVTDLVNSGTTEAGIKKAIDNLEDLLNRSPHYSNNTFDLIKFFTMPQTNPGGLLDDCLTGNYATSQKYFPNELRFDLRYFVNKCIKEQNGVYYGAIPDDVIHDIFNELAPDKYFAYLKRKGVDEAKSKNIVKREYAKMKNYLQKED